jgi:hypothetical protein
MDERGRRIGRNEAFFREANERIEQLSQKLETTGGRLEILCECGDPGCHERIEITMVDYEQVRSDPTHFATARGHEQPDVETVVENRDGYVVVRKAEGPPAEIAEKLDPRS